MNRNKLDKVDDVHAERENFHTPFNQILEQCLARRELLKYTGLFSSSAILSGMVNAKTDQTQKQVLRFKEITHGMDETLHVPEGYSYQVLLRWGDPLFPDVPEFDPAELSNEIREKQFGYNNDFVAYTPKNFEDRSSTNGLLVVNHEYVESMMMNPGSPNSFRLSKEQINAEIVAVGLSIVEIQRYEQDWKINLYSELNRRITPHTKMKFSGPACGHDRLKTVFAADGTSCVGTYGNCAGCLTPWGTILTAEENIQSYFMGEAKQTKESENYNRFGLKGNSTAAFNWAKYHDRWNLDKHPQSGLHAGWIVEVDPYDPEFVPVKRTALGRCKHEGCDVYINHDGRVVVYMGDDQIFEYIYRFVSKHKFSSSRRKQNIDLLDEGELSVAEFTDHGSLIWHPLVYGRGPHNENNGFYSQADIVLDMRKAADLVGATPMDRPEEIKVNPSTGTIFAVLTNNVRRDPIKLNLANPRVFNVHGHILELIPPNQDHSSREFKWEVFILAGNPKNKLDRAYYHTSVSNNGWFSNPDNCTFDSQGNIWIGTDGFYRHGCADGIWAGAALGSDKALTKQFLRAPKAAEVCSPCFTPDEKTLFCSIQHPGENSSFDNPSTRWPDFNEKHPPRPSVVAITQDLNEDIGS